MGIGDRLKEERERLGFNQTDFAAKAGASKNTQYNYEKGERSPDASYLAAVAEQGVDILYVVIGERNSRPVEGLTSVEEGLIAQYRRLPEFDQQATLRIIGAMSEAADASQK